MIAGGGTGGHVYPGIAIYHSLRAAHGDVEVLFVGAKGGVEGGIFARLGLPCVLLPGKGVRGKSAVSKIAAPFILKWSVIQAIRAIISFKPDVVVGTGGYASVSAVAAAAICRKTRILQEQNSVPGLANRLMSRIANLVLLSYEESRAHLNERVPSVVVGNPLRFDPDRHTCSRSEALEFFGLKPERTVLIFGGSRGARSLNEAGAEAAKILARGEKAQFVFVSGERDFEWVQQELGSFASRIKVIPFLEEMNKAYAAADVAVARAGASSVFELAAFGIPTVFVPFPYAADDHQRKNIAALEKIAAVKAIEDADLSGEVLAALIEWLLDNEGERAAMSDRMRSWAKTNAASLAAEAIMDLVKKNAPSEMHVLRKSPHSDRGTLAIADHYCNGARCPSNES